MSLKFGIYLVEQRIITPEQFCGLVKIQQESTRSLASIAITQNYLTMKQVSRILDGVQQDEGKFLGYAIDKGLLDRSDATHLSRLQEQGGESIRSLAVECGLLSERQSDVLFNHFQRCGARPVRMDKSAVAAKSAQSAPVSTPRVPTKPRPIIQPKSTPSPKFKQHPITKSDEVQH